MEVDGRTQPLQCVNTTNIFYQQVNVTAKVQWAYLTLLCTDTAFFKTLYPFKA